MTTFSKATISVGGDILTLANIDALRNHLPRRLKDGTSVIVSGSVSPGDANGGLYVWSETSMVPDNGLTVIRPDTTISAGRWLMSVGRGIRGDVGPIGLPGPSGAANSTYASVVALQAAPKANLSAILTDPLRKGVFSWSADNHTAHIASDPMRAVYVPPITDNTGASGAWVRQYDELNPTWFGAVGGNAAVDTPAIQAALNFGGTINLGLLTDTPFVINTGIVISKARTVLTGQRRIETTADVYSTEAIKLAANDSVIDGITLSNPSLVNQQAGYQNWGIAIGAQRCKVVNCSVLDFQMCIGVLPVGEFYDSKMIANYCRVLGGGNGPMNTVSDEGENRGDGIADFGARSQIIGNTIQAANALYANNGNGPRIPGTDYNDCRIGIDVEGLNVYSAAGPDANAGTIVADNIIIPSEDGKGRFRRCISTEGIERVIITGNYGRGYTWCGIWYTGSSNHGVCSDNVMLCTTDPADKTGGIWQPDRAGILVYAGSGVTLENAVIANNVVTSDTNFGNGIMLNAPYSIIKNVSFNGNRVNATTDMSGNSAFFIRDGDIGISMTDNHVSGKWTNGLYALSCTELNVKGGTIRNVINGINFIGVDFSTVSGVTINGASTGIGFAGVGVAVIENNITKALTSTTVTISGVGVTHFIGNTHLDGGGVFFDFGQGSVKTVKGNTGYNTFLGAAAITPGSLLDGAGQTFDVTAPNAVPGDRVVVSYNQPMTGIFAFGMVKAGNTVSVRYQNWSGATVTPPAGVLTVMVERG